MSERKVLQLTWKQKYYPPDFDPRDISRRRGPKTSGPRIQTVRLMAPFSMRCMTCGEFIYKGRKFNSRKETNLEERYLGIQVFFFHIKCTRCSAEITFRTDPKNNDYAMVKGAVRNMEPWRNRETEDETMEERLDRLEKEEAEAAGEEEKNAMADLEAKNADARREMAAADALDEIRQRNARINRSENEGVDYADAIVRTGDEERAQQEREDEEAAKRAFAAARVEADIEIDDESETSNGLSRVDESSKFSSDNGASASTGSDMPPPPPPPTFKRVVKKKKNHSALLGIKKKPSLV
ncbi:Coiled-coil domain-containing protein 94 [Tolypocladium ophioglossoides CBS 100239]|uniref:Splicing factor YJU2 n=1 Tax=Tolypocladium ophioglossoides (strain CBS 100239) TaxID=1163406 RepID=A0A0L0NHM6_TOLOC|nr:Coiled-coil domain-containing protein 94 [Tolypocladium ophioglossoides CBS 100239]